MPPLLLNPGTHRPLSHRWPNWPQAGRRAGAVFALAIIALSLGCGSDSAPAGGERAAETKSDSSETTSRSNAEYGPRQQVVRIETNLGTIAINLDAEKAPGTVNNFLRYASEGFYDNTLIHYVAPGSMILGGGYAADHQPKSPTFSPIWSEAHNGRKNIRGTIAMTRDPAVIDSATTQFFINLADAPQRDHTGDSPEEYGYCVFGDIIEGLEVADRIAQSPTTDQGGDLAQTPQTPVVVQTIRVL